MRELKGESLINFIDDYTLIDIETTGYSPIYDEIIELGAVHVKSSEVIESYSSLIKPPYLINDFIMAKTGITNEMVVSSPSLDMELHNYLDFLGESILVGHNVNFDINFLYDNSLEILGKPLCNDYIDTLRLSRRLMKTLDNYRLSTIANCFNIDCSKAHRALADCFITYQCYENLKNIGETYYTKTAECIIQHLRDIGKYQQLYDMFHSKKISVKGSFLNIDSETICNILRGVGARVTYNLYKGYDYLIYPRDNYGDLSYYGYTVLIGEVKLCEILDIPIKDQKTRNAIHHLKASEIIADNKLFNEDSPIYNRACVFTGTLQKMTREQAMQIVANIGGKCLDTVTKKTNFLIIGSYDYSSQIKDGKSNKRKKAEEYILEGYDITIISENEFYDMIEVANE